MEPKMVCEFSWHVAVGASMEDRRIVLMLWDKCCMHTNDVWIMYATVKDELEAEDLQEKVEALHKEILRIEKNVLSREHQAYSERSIWGPVSINWECNY